MLLADALQVPGEVRLHYGRQHRHPVLVALAAPHDDLVRPEIHALDAEAAALEEPEPGAIEKKRHESRRAREARDFGRPHVGGVALVVEEDVVSGWSSRCGGRASETF